MITLTPYNPYWTIMFEQEKSTLLSLCGNWINTIEHIGSTSIPNIHAKPIIDIMIGVHQLADAD